MKYKWKRTPKNAPTAQSVGEYLQSLKDKHGILIPAIIVREAKKKKSILHNCFEWNDTLAALEHRKAQAREILRYLVIVETDEAETESVYVRAFIAPSDTGSDSGYLTVAEVVDDDALNATYKKVLLAELLAIKAKIKNYKEFENVVNAIREVTLT